MREIAVVGRGSEAMALEIGQFFLPARVLAASETGDEKLPLLASKNGGADAAAMIFLCENEACRAPVATVEELAAML